MEKINDEYVMSYEIQVVIGEKCPGSGWPPGGDWSCMGCGLQKPIGKKGFVSSHKLTK